MFQKLKMLLAGGGGGEDFQVIRQRILDGEDIASGQFDLEQFHEEFTKDDELLRLAIQGFIDRNQWKEAQRYLALADKLPKKPEWYSLLNAELAQKAGRLGKKTLQEFLDLAANNKLTPGQVRHLQKLIVTCGECNLNEINILSKANDNLPEPDETVELYLADWQEKKKRFGRETLRYFQFAAARKPNEPRWLYAIVRSQQNSGATDAAREGLQQLLVRFPNFPDARLLARELDRNTPRHPTPTTSATPTPAGGTPAEGTPAEGTPADGATPAPTSTSGTVAAATVTDTNSGGPDAPGGFPARYTRFTELGRGGNGIVYRAFDENLKRPVSIKTLHTGGISAEDRERFIREAQIMASLNHPAILSVFDLSVTEPFFICSEFIEGKALREIIEMKLANQVLLTRQHAVFVLKLLHDVAQGFEYAAQNGILHRDIKPDNILIDKKGRALIIDFGLAIGATSSRLTQTNIVVGTPWYLAPERLNGEEATVRSEIYAFGVMLYEAMVGGLPYTGKDIVCVFAQEPTPIRQVYADLPEELEILLLECLCKNPDNRPESFAQVAQTMGEIIASMTKG